MMDGCTWFPEVWRGISLTACCNSHDIAWSHPSGVIDWAASNLALGGCFFMAGAWELAIPTILAVSTIGTLIFFGRKRSPE